jgi:hypothetical protein
VRKSALTLCFVLALSLSACGEGKQNIAASSDANSAGAIVSKLVEAEGSVEISHRLLTEAFTELESAGSSDQYVLLLKTNVRRGLDAEALHCQRAFDKITAIKNGLDSSSLDANTRDELTPILAAFLDTYSTRKAALLKAASAIEALDTTTKSLPKSGVKEAIVRVKEGEENAQETALKLAAFCAKHGIAPVQK